MSEPLHRRYLKRTREQLMGPSASSSSSVASAANANPHNPLSGHLAHPPRRLEAYPPGRTNPRRGLPLEAAPYSPLYLPQRILPPPDEPGGGQPRHWDFPPARSNQASREPSVPGPIAVIDLTVSPPPRPRNQTSANNGGPSRSRGHAEIIDVDALPDEPSPPVWDRVQVGGSGSLANDLEVTFSRNTARLNGGLRQQQQRAHQPRPVEPPLPRNHIQLPAGFQPRFHQEMDSPIMGRGARVGHAMPDMDGGLIGGHGPGGQGIRSLPGVMNLFSGFRRMPFGFQLPGDVGQVDFLPFEAPAQLDYRQRAPGIIHEESPGGDDVARMRNLDYKKPLPAREGYTRSPKDDDILACADPDCHWELGAENEEDAIQEQVWVTKCGHCYCGACIRRYRTPAPCTKPTSRPTKRPKIKARLCAVCSNRNNLVHVRSAFRIHL